MKLTKKELKVWRQYSKMRGSRIYRCKIDQLEVHLNGEFEHELSKFKIFWKLRKEGNRVITEAWDKEGSRRDLVDISNNEIYECENSKKKRGLRHSKGINVFWYNLGRFRTTEEVPKEQ